MFATFRSIFPKPVTFKGINSEGNVHIRQTSYTRNARDPVWNELVMLGENEWQFFRIQAYYEYSPSESSPYFMSMSQTIVLSSLCTKMATELTRRNSHTYCKRSIETIQSDTNHCLATNHCSATDIKYHKKYFQPCVGPVDKFWM